MAKKADGTHLSTILVPKFPSRQELYQKRLGGYGNKGQIFYLKQAHRNVRIILSPF
jgi:hypothetical protein